MWQSRGDSFLSQLLTRCLDAFKAFQTITAQNSLHSMLESCGDDGRNDAEARIKRENKAVVLFLGHLYLHLH